MKPRRRLAAAIAVLALGLSPALAGAQSAGDDQYEDPFADEQSENATPTPTPSPVTDDPGFAPDDEPAEPAQVAEGEETPAATEPEADPAQEELPRTGADAGLVALFGSGLVLTGVGLRLRLRDAHGRR